MLWKSWGHERLLVFLKVQGTWQRDVTSHRTISFIAFYFTTATLKRIRRMHAWFCLSACVSVFAALFWHQEVIGNRGSVAGVYVQRSSVFLPRRLEHSSEGLFSLLRHTDDTANQRVLCFMSLRKKIQKNVFSPTCCIIELEAVTFIYNVEKLSNTYLWYTE